MYIAISQKVTLTLGDDGCLEVPEIPQNQNLYVVWPSDDSTDCICPLCDMGNCVLSKCECYKKNSTSAPKLSHNSTGYTICWPTLAPEKNNSNVHFFFEAMIKQPDDTQLISRIYGGERSTYNFIIKPGKG